MMSDTKKQPAADAATTADSAQRWVKCPQCGGPSLYSPANRFRPFCGERCKQIDLGAWASEEFRMPTEAPPEDAEFGDPRLLP